MAGITINALIVMPGARRQTPCSALPFIKRAHLPKIRWACIRAKHGVSFDEAMTVLSDPKAVVRLDLDHADIEDRFLTVGFSFRSRLLAVVTSEPPQGSIRITSARRATKRERHAYETGSF